MTRLRRRGELEQAAARALEPSNANSGAAMTITLTLNGQTLSEGQTISGSSFVSSVTDSARRSITQYSVYDSGADGGYFVLGGVKLSDGAWHNLTAAQFAQLNYVSGATAGSETVSIKAYDGCPMVVDLFDHGKDDSPNHTAVGDGGQPNCDGGPDARGLFTDQIYQRSQRQVDFDL